jgi:hypothetical protein
MSKLELSAYTPAIAELLELLPLASLDPGTPDHSVKGKLQAVDDAAFGGGRMDRGMADACRAGLWLAFNFLDEAHSISQDIDTPTGSYWHGLLHRREPDYANAKYWFRRVGRHPIFEPLRIAAGQMAVAESVKIPSPWDPFWFIDFCESCLTQREPHEMLARRIQQQEWELLFDHCYRRALVKSDKE